MWIRPPDLRNVAAQSPWAAGAARLGAGGAEFSQWVGRNRLFPTRSSRSRPLRPLTAVSLWILHHALPSTYCVSDPELGVDGSGRTKAASWAPAALWVGTDRQIQALVRSSTVSTF